MNSQKKYWFYIIVSMVFLAKLALAQGWQIEQITNDSNTNLVGDIAVGSDGIVHVVYQQGIKKKVRGTTEITDNVLYTFKTNGVWNSPIALGQSEQDERGPAMSVDDLGVAHVVFSKVDPVDGLAKIYYWNSTRTADDLTPLDGYPESVTLPINAFSADIAVESSGTVHVALLGWHDNPFFGSEVYYTNNATNNTFAPLQLVEPVSNLHSSRPSIDVDENGKVAIAFSTLSGQNFNDYTAVYTTNVSGNFLNNPVVIATDPFWQDYTKVRAANGFAFYFYPQADFDNLPSGPGIADMFYVKLNEADGSHEFTAPVLFRQLALHTSGYMTYQNGRVYFSWIEYRQETQGKKTVNIPELYYMVLDANTGTQVSAPEEITDGGQGHTNMTVDSNGDAHIVYRSSGNIFYATNAIPPPGVMMHVEDILMTAEPANGGRWRAVAEVPIEDDSGQSVSGATVTGAWTGLVSGTGTATTNGNGVATISSPKTRKNGQITFEVTDVTKAGFTYNSGANLETSDSIAGPPIAKTIAEGTNSETPTEFALLGNYPNPFNPETLIRFNLPKGTYVTLRVYNTLGHEIRTLTSASHEAGQYSIRWDSKDSNGNAVSSGVYLYQLQAGSFSQIRKMTLLR